MLTIATAILFVVLGDAIARTWDRRHAFSGLAERACAAVTIGTALWLGSSWALALVHRLTHGVVVARSTIVLLLAVLVTAPRLSLRGWRALNPERLFLVLVPFLAPLWFIGYILWRDAVLFPVSHDALAYHLPKAVLFARARGFDPLLFLDPRLRNIPANFEMLLTDFFVLDRSDVLVEWLTMFFCIAFVTAGAALVNRWWRESPTAISAVAILIASTPVLLLQSGSVKNDAMTAFFMTSMLVWGGRFIATGESAALLLLALSTVMGVGTKPQAGILAAALAPWLMPRMLRQWRSATSVVVLALLLFPLLGGATYISNLVHQHEWIGLAMNKHGDEPLTRITYGDWRNLWQGPWVLLTAPFSNSTEQVWVPGERGPWFWQKYEVFFSHLGGAFSLCAVLLPLTVFWFSRYRPESRIERIGTSIAAACTLVVMLPVRFDPHGFYPISLPRYTLFLLPVVFGLTIAPALNWCEQHAPTVAYFACCAFSVVFALQAIDYGPRDRFAPIEYFRWARDHPGTRHIPFNSNRAESQVDRLAGPNDAIGIDGDYLAWLYPAFGRSLSRPIYFIHANNGPPVIPPDVKWIAVDRGANTVWGDARFSDLSQWHTYLGHGRPTFDDEKVLRYLLSDRRFELLSYERGAVQAVFRRVAR